MLAMHPMLLAMLQTHPETLLQLVRLWCSLFSLSSQVVEKERDALVSPPSPILLSYPEGVV
jgi:hypothetical protein